MPTPSRPKARPSTIPSRMTALISAPASCDAEIRATDFRIPVELLGRAAEADPTVLEHVAAVGDGERERHLLLGYQQGHAAPLEPLESLERSLRDLRRE